MEITNHLRENWAKYGLTAIGVLGVVYGCLSKDKTVVNKIYTVGSFLGFYIGAKSLERKLER